MSLVLGEMVMMFAVAGGDVVRDECGCGCGCVGAGGFVAIWIRCGWVCVAVSLGLCEMVMMFAATGGDVRGRCGCGRLVLLWVGCMVRVLKKNIKEELFYNILI